MPSFEAKVKSIVTNSKGDLLLVRELRERIAGLRWNVISGTVEVGAESIPEAAAREVYEEAGVHIQPVVRGMYAVGRTTIASTGEPVKSRVYVPNFIISGHTDDEPRLAPTPEQVARSEYIADVRWFTRREVDELSPEQVAGGFALHLLRTFYDNSSASADFFLRVYEAD